MVDAREYHERTNHSPRSVREDDFRLNWSNKPRPYKIYEDLPWGETRIMTADKSGEPAATTCTLTADELGVPSGAFDEDPADIRCSRAVWGKAAGPRVSGMRTRPTSPTRR